MMCQALYTEILAINDSGTFVDFYIGTTTQGFFMYSNGRFTPLDFSALPQTGYAPVAINNLNQILLSSADQFVDYIYDNGVYTTLDISGFQGTTSTGVATPATPSCHTTSTL